MWSDDAREHATRVKKRPQISSRHTRKASVFEAKVVENGLKTSKRPMFLTFYGSSLTGQRTECPKGKSFGFYCDKQKFRKV